MTGDELGKACRKIIDQYDKNYALTDEEQADKVLEGIPEMIEAVMKARGKREIAVHNLCQNSNQNLARGRSSDDPISIFGRTNGVDVFDRLFGGNKPQPDKEHLLVGVDKIVYQKLKAAKLNPFVAHLIDKETNPQYKKGIQQFAIGISW